MVGVQQLIVEVKNYCTVCNLCDMMIDRVGVELLVAEKVRPPWLPPQVPWCPDRAPGGAHHTIPYHTMVIVPALVPQWCQWCLPPSGNSPRRWRSQASGEKSIIPTLNPHQWRLLV